ncbi:TonB-dependent receptor [Catenovulum agarivorans DS-2]|uniref:TonB-dependent receptor n=1 Tax=Catenovulum agarivorans DS-2 TaxID=1328313 RepID=W7Q8R7_9ALTE|nr:TonB-dependent receptor [Catenovulum agarivorans]EWH09214.1 TonB-dependent receptor [Catenovulum agarivorans DS-2]
MKYNFKLKAVTAAVLATCFATTAYAAEEDTEVDSVDQNKTAEDIETIEIKGFRGSLRKAMNAKRFSQSVSDSIHAEDVGKSTDQNIADALSRVTGVTVTEENGEGARISIRGAGPSMNQISMNGVALTGGLSDPGSDGIQDNSVDLSSFSSDILSSIDVVKTAAADQDEGSLGGSVSLRTVKPLALQDDRLTATIEGRYNKYADENDIRVNGSFSKKFFNDVLGVIVTVSHDNQKTRQDRIQSDYVNGVLPIADWEADSGRKATDLNGKQIRVLGYTTDDEGVRTLNDVSSLTNYDEATQVAISEDEAWATAKEFYRIGLNRDERKRTSISSGIQLRPTDSLDIQLDLTHTQQKTIDDEHALTLNMAPANQLQTSDDINVIDLSTHTIEKMYGRSFTGGFNRTSGERDLETNVASLSVDYHITDNLNVKLLAGYSKTVDETPLPNTPGQYISMSTNTWGTAGRDAVLAMPNFENVGYDCTQGSITDCNIVTGTTLGVFDAFDGTPIDVRSRFNPFDLQHNHVGGFTFRNNALEDKNKSLFLDLDYLLDTDYLTKIEFGVKYAKRERQVLVSNVSITNAGDIPAEGEETSEPPRGLGNINVGDILSQESFPYDNFAQDIQADRSNALFNGWPMLDTQKALGIITNGDDLEERVNFGNSRFIETETAAAYLKLNFEGFDGRLTGNIGVRKVRDENAAIGFGELRYINVPQLVDPYDLLVVRNLGDMSQPACPEAQVGEFGGKSDWRGVVPNDSELRNCWAWQVTHAYNRTDASTYPYDTATGEFLLAGPDGTAQQDVNRVLWMNSDGTIQNSIPVNSELTIYTDQAGVTKSSNAGNWVRFGAPAQAPIWPFISRETSRFSDGPNGPISEHDEKTYYRVGIATDSSTTEALLPSLNLNFAVNDEMIVRFATSKTMTRPNIDSRNPRTQIRENQWGTTDGQAGNTKLDFLKSTNLDLSFEWYFNEEGMVSVALFNKDMQGQEVRVQTPYHYKDKKTDYNMTDFNILMPFDENRTPGDADNCHSHRFPAGWIDQWEITCDVAVIDQVRNAGGSKITGLELGYTQTYDFLPGILSGLGASINYTYQSSEQDDLEIGTTGVFIESMPVELTPEHSANTTIFWEQDGASLRLAHRYTGVQLVNGGILGGAVWQEETSRLDFSANYQINKNFTVTFNALNLLDDDRRTFYTIGNATDATNTDSVDIRLDEGNYFNGGVKTRTFAAFKTGQQFRVGLRLNF